LDINANLTDELIIGKVLTKYAPKLEQIKLSVPSNNNIEFSGNNSLFINVPLVEINKYDDIIEYEFEFRINILNHGCGNIIVNFHSFGINIIHKFFIIPNLFEIFNSSSTNNKIETTLP
jgi:hypothetical protein